MLSSMSSSKSTISSGKTSRRNHAIGGASGAALESLEGRTLMSTYSFTVSVDPYHTGLTSGHDTGSGSLAATAITITASTAPMSETVLQTALTQASVTLSANHTSTQNGTYSGSGPSSSNRLLFLTAEGTGKNYPGTHSRESSLADAYGLAGDYVVGFEDGTDFDYNDGYFLVTITDTTPPPGGAIMASPAIASPFSVALITPTHAADSSVLA